MKSRSALTTLVVSLILIASAHAVSPPDRTHFQGVLRDDNGFPENGEFDMVFRFFDSNTGGNEIVVDEHVTGVSTPVTVTDGLFNVRLGTGNMLDGTGIFPDDPYVSLNAAFR